MLRDHNYRLDNTSVALAMMNVNVTSGQNYRLSFDWMAKGESHGDTYAYDFIKVFGKIYPMQYHLRYGL